MQEFGIESSKHPLECAAGFQESKGNPHTKRNLKIRAFEAIDIGNSGAWFSGDDVLPGALKSETLIRSSTP